MQNWHLNGAWGFTLASWRLCCWRGLILGCINNCRPTLRIFVMLEMKQKQFKFQHQFQGVSGNSHSSTRAVFPTSRASILSLLGSYIERDRHVPSHIYVCSSISSRVSASLRVSCVFHPRSSINVWVCFVISLARLNATCVFVACYWSSTHVYVLLCISCWILTSSLCLLLVFQVILIFYVPLRVILFHILMLTPFQRTSTLLVPCTPTPHKPWARLAPLITPLCSATLSLVLKLHFLSLKTYVTFHLLLSRWVNVFLKPLLPKWRIWVATKLYRHCRWLP